METVPSSAAATASHDGRTYYFCSRNCLSKFEADPSKYLGNRTEPPPSPQPEGSYTCPMHPEIIRDQPGNCPICGMALEPKAVQGAEEENGELKDMRRRLWIS